MTETFPLLLGTLHWM